MTSENLGSKISPSFKHNLHTPCANRYQRSPGSKGSSPLWVFNGTAWNSQAAVVCLCLGNLAVLKTDLMAALEKGGEVGRWTKIVGSLGFISPKSTLVQDLVVFHTSLFGPQKAHAGLKKQKKTCLLLQGHEIGDLFCLLVSFYRAMATLLSIFIYLSCQENSVTCRDRVDCTTDLHMKLCSEEEIYGATF
ncbi:hypothetical protein AAC387_Pa07g2912 [Persea americana]